VVGIGIQVGAFSPIRPNVVWAMDFQFDTTADGRQIKLLNVIDEFTRECLAIEVDRSIDADQVTNVLDRIALQRGGAPVGTVALTGWVRVHCFDAYRGDPSVAHRHP